MTPEERDWLQRRPALAVPFTVLTGPGTVRLVAGEDYRYTLSAAGLEAWLPAFLAAADGSASLADLLGRHVPADRRTEALILVQRLYGERVLIDGSAADAHAPRPPTLTVHGTGALAELLQRSSPGAEGGIEVFCQDRLDYTAALAFDHRCRHAGRAWLWVSTAPMRRGYVSPLFLPQAGPCFGCLLSAFRRLSPAPEVYDSLIEHGRQGGEFAPVPFPPEASAILAELVRWKAARAGDPQPNAALYRLHVLELDTMEVSTHRVLIDPDCAHFEEGPR